MGRGEVQRGFWWGNLMERDHLENPDLNIRMILKCMRGISSLAENPLSSQEGPCSMELVFFQHLNTSNQTKNLTLNAVILYLNLCNIWGSHGGKCRTLC
jgi:hypothetical protein